MVGGHLEKTGRLPHRLTGEVHIGHRLHQQNLFSPDLQGVGEGAVLELLDGYPSPLRQLIGYLKAHIVPGVVVLFTDVAKAHYQPGYAARCPSEKHGYHLTGLQHCRKGGVPAGQNGPTGAPRTRPQAGEDAYRNSLETEISS